MIHLSLYLSPSISCIFLFFSPASFPLKCFVCHPCCLGVVSPSFGLGSGKTSAAQQLAASTGLVYINPVIAINQVLQGPHSALRRRLQRFLRAGRAAPRELVMEAMAHAASSFPASVRGFVLDDAIATEGEAATLDALGIRPNVVLEVAGVNATARAAAAAGVHNALAVRGFGLGYKAKPKTEDGEGEEEEEEGGSGRPQWRVLRSNCLPYQGWPGAAPLRPPHLSDMAIVGRRMQMWHRQADGLRAYYLNRYDNVQVLDGNKSRYAMNTAAVEHMNRARRHCEEYARAQAKGWPSRIADIPIPQRSLLRMRGPFGQYCPVQWYRNRQLYRSSDRRNAVKCGSHVYFCSSDAAAADFISHPTLYLAGQRLPRRNRIPEPLPVSAQVALPLRLKGICPVIATRRPNRSGLVYGDPALRVIYRGGIYNLKDGEAMNAFLRQPWKYVA